MAVSDNERKIENLRKDHETWGAKLHDLQMTDKDSKDQKKSILHKREKDSHKHFYPKIDLLEK